VGEINNLRYVEDTTLMAESKEELKNLLMRVKEESEKVGLKPNIKKTKIMASSPVTSWQIEGEQVEIVTAFLFLGIRMRIYLFQSSVKDPLLGLPDLLTY